MSSFIDKKLRKIRADDYLMQNEIVSNLQQAKTLILTGRVMIDHQKIQKTFDKVMKNASYHLLSSKTYVSRGAYKLLEAIQNFRLKEEFQEKIVLDVGASTGGFTQACLEHRAKTVLALDVGKNQLDWSLRKNPKVVVLESMHIKDFNDDLYPSPDWILADISFNSFTRLARYFCRIARNHHSRLLCLIKPQFELPREDIPLGGIIKDPKQQAKAVEMVQTAFSQEGFDMLGKYACRTKGRRGNQEFFAYFEQQKKV